MSIATAQTSAHATDDLTGLYVYSWGQRQWCLVLDQTRAGDTVSYRVEGQDSPVTAHAADDVQVCLP